MSVKQTKLQKPYWEMTADELDKATREFDQEFIIDTFGPPPPEAMAQLRRAKRKGRGRPKMGKGCKDVLISVEKDLLRQADAFAKKHRISRSELFTNGVRSFLKAG